MRQAEPADRETGDNVKRTEIIAALGAIMINVPLQAATSTRKRHAFTQPKPDETMTETD